MIKTSVTTKAFIHKKKKNKHQNFSDQFQHAKVNFKTTYYQMQHRVNQFFMDGKIFRSCDENKERRGSHVND